MGAASEHPPPTLTLISKEQTVETCKVLFDSIAWQEATPGARFKIFTDGKKQMRLLEFTSEFVEPHWCEKGHILV